MEKMPISGPWWENPKLACPPEVAAEFKARSDHERRTGCPPDAPPSRNARRLRARYMDMLSDASEKARRTPTHYRQIVRDLDDVDERDLLERQFERALGLR